MMHVTCAHCGGTVQVPESAAGHKGKCPFCAQAVSIPSLKPKTCTICKKDVSAVKRVKDPQGHYFCEPCYQSRAAALQKKVGQAAAPVAVRARAGSSGGGGAAVIAKPAADDDAFALADEPAPRPAGPSLSAPPPIAARPLPAEPKSEPDLYDLDEDPVAAALKKGPMAACGECKKVLPESSVINHDGEFICRACITKRSQTLAYANPEPADKTAVVNKTWLFTILHITASCVGGAVVLFILLLLFPQYSDSIRPFSDPVSATVLFTVIYTAVDFLKVVFLMFSMFVAGQIFGGLDFGMLHHAVMKCWILVVGTQLIEMSSRATGDFSIFLGFMYPVIFVIACIAAFQLDYLEAVVVSVCNYGFRFLTAIMLVVLKVIAIGILGLTIGSGGLGSGGGSPSTPGSVPMPVPR